jgi:hypothetical protein
MQGFADGLRDQHVIEWIAMMSRQSGNQASVFASHGQLLENRLG